jgi:hypothetical protein
MRYFYHDTNAHENRKLRKIVRTHGAQGLGIYWTLLELLYRQDDEGFQINADSLWLEDMTEKLHISDSRTLIRVFDTFAEVDLVSKQLWADHVLYSEAIAKRGDQYVTKKIYERERKREQRASKLEKPLNVPSESQQCPTGQNGTSSNFQIVPLSDPDPNADPNSKTNSNTFKEKSIYTVHDSDFEVFREIWNRDRLSHWSECKVLNKPRIAFLKRFYNDNGEDSLEILQNALKYAKTDKWCNDRKTVLTIDNFFSNNKVVGYAEKYDSSLDSVSSSAAAKESEQQRLMQMLGGLHD